MKRPSLSLQPISWRTWLWLLPVFFVLSYASCVAARRSLQRYTATKQEALALGERVSKVMPESGRFYTAMVMLSHAARTNAAAAGLVHRYGINFVAPDADIAKPGR